MPCPTDKQAERTAQLALQVLDGLPIEYATLRRSGIGKVVVKLRKKEKAGDGPHYYESLR